MKKLEHSERCLVIEIQTGNLYADSVCVKMTDQEHATSNKMPFICTKQANTKSLSTMKTKHGKKSLTPTKVT